MEPDYAGSPPRSSWKYAWSDASFSGMSTTSRRNPPGTGNRASDRRRLASIDRPVAITTAALIAACAAHQTDDIRTVVLDGTTADDQNRLARFSHSQIV